MPEAKVTCEMKVNINYFILKCACHLKKSNYNSRFHFHRITTFWRNDHFSIIARLAANHFVDNKYQDSNQYLGKLVCTVTTLDQGN